MLRVGGKLTAEGTMFLFSAPLETAPSKEISEGGLLGFVEKTQSWGFANKFLGFLSKGEKIFRSSLVWQ